VFDNTHLLEDVKIDNSIPADIYISNSLDYSGRLDVFEGAKDP